MLGRPRSSWSAAVSSASASTIIRRSPAICALRQAAGRVRPLSKVARSVLCTTATSTAIGWVVIMGAPQVGATPTASHPSSLCGGWTPTSVSSGRGLRDRRHEDRRGHRLGRTSCSRRCRLSHASSGGMPPSIGWSMAKAKGPWAVEVGHQLAGVTRWYCPLARSSSPSVRRCVPGVEIGRCGPRTVGVGLVERVGLDGRPRRVGVTGHDAHSRAATEVIARIGPTHHRALGSERRPALTRAGLVPHAEARRRAGPPRRCSLRASSSGPPDVNGAGVTRTVRPRCSKGSPVHACRSTRTVSVVRPRARPWEPRTWRTPRPRTRS